MRSLAMFMVFEAVYSHQPWVFKHARAKVNSTCTIDFDSMCIVTSLSMSVPYKPIRASNESSNGAFMYVLTARHDLLVSKTDHLSMVHACSSTKKLQRLTHPCMVPDGEDIIGAGQLWVKHHKVWIIDNFSGHYTPPDDSLDEVEKAVSLHGLRGLKAPIRLGWYRELSLRTIVARGGTVNNSTSSMVSEDENVLERARASLKVIERIKEERAQLGGLAHRHRNQLKKGRARKFPIEYKTHLSEDHRREQSTPS